MLVERKIKRADKNKHSIWFGSVRSVSVILNIESNVNQNNVNSQLKPLNGLQFAKVNKHKDSDRNIELDLERIIAVTETSLALATFVNHILQTLSELNFRQAHKQEETRRDKKVNILC